MIRFHRRTTAAIDQSLRSAHGRTLDDYDILHQLHERDTPTRMGDLAASLLIANSSCHRIVGRLVEDGLITRQHSETDRRVVLVELSSAGKRLRRRMAATHTKDIRRMVGTPLDESAQDALNAALDELLD